jgi:hypothetical protein
MEVILIELPDEAREIAVLEVFRKNRFGEFFALTAPW